MAEEFISASLVLPGTYIRVRSEGLIGVGGISTGNIGLVGTASGGVSETHNLSSAAEALDNFGDPDAVTTRKLNLTRIATELFKGGARTVYARGVAQSAVQTDYEAAFAEIIKEDVQILVAPELDTLTALAVLQPILESSENNGQDLIAVVGADGADANTIEGQTVNNDRVILVAPGYFVPNPADPDNRKADVALPGNFIAAPVAGLISTLAPHSSPTNKSLPGVPRLTQRFSYSERVKLVNNRIFALEQRQGVRVVRGLTTDNAGFTQVTTRRIVDFAKAGIRKVSNPFIGRLNNVRIRAALQGAIDGFLTTMLVDEQLTNYQLEVTATRQDEINSRVIVNVLLQPTFSIDFVAVTLVLE
ncbi:MAG: phage tail sheath protein [Candidatus Electrothrix sp. AR5]|nr:phage tail sheath protein [Candidatus Electrothrix sp. AR5]